MKSETENSLPTSLTKTIINSDTRDILMEIGEITLDSFLADGLLKDIPIVSSIIGLGKTAIKINDYFFIRKLVEFLRKVDKVPEEKKDEFREKMNGNNDYSAKVGETLLFIIDRLDSIEKPALIAKIFNSYIGGNINYSEFITFSTLVERLPIQTLKDFLKVFSGDSLDWRKELEVRCEVHLYGLSDLYFDIRKYLKDIDIAKKSGSHNSPNQDGRNLMVYRYNQLADSLAKLLLG